LAGKFSPGTLADYGQRKISRIKDVLRLVRLARTVSRQARPDPGQRPVVFFNASTRLSGLSLNAAFSLVTSWAVRLAGVPVVHFACEAGMSHCVLGTDRDDFSQPPPCAMCIRQSRFNYAHAGVHWFTFQRDGRLAEALAGLDLADLMSFQFPVTSHQSDTIHSSLVTRYMPLGALVQPSIRWILRLHNLQDDEVSRYLYREYILSAWNVARQFNALLDRINPQTVVLFNGQFFPEATVRWLCQQRDIRVLTHEVGFQPLTAFFTDGEATIYPIEIPDDFELTDSQNARLDAYLENRFQGNFSMAGVRFWPQMKGLDKAFLNKVAGFKQIVPIFTNVIFDTSQPHSNTIFSDMFAWMDMVLEVIKKHPETLFVIRAHPDESRPGKSSRESVAAWIEQHQATDLPNVVFVPPDEYISSYELIQRAKFVMIYNSTIGLEATIMGTPVLCAGKARFTQYPIVFFPSTQKAYRKQLEDFLAADHIAPSPEHSSHARRFLYYQLFRASLPFESYLEATESKGYVRLKSFDWKSLLSAVSPTTRTLLDGILHNGDLLLDEQELHND
jgi:hypothetical protein